MLCFSHCSFESRLDQEKDFFSHTPPGLGAKFRKILFLGLGAHEEEASDIVLV
jgi:hypothetical protein